MSQVIEERACNAFRPHMHTHVSISIIPLDFETLHYLDSPPISVYAFIGSSVSTLVLLSLNCTYLSMPHPLCLLSLQTTLANTIATSHVMVIEPLKVIIDLLN